MKKILLMIFIGVFAVGTITVIILTQNHEKIDSKFISVQTFATSYFSGKKTSPENTPSAYDDYKINFTSGGNNVFGATSVSFSANVLQKSCITETNLIEFSFNINAGTSFSITIKSENYKDLIKTYDCTPYNQYEDLSLSFEKLEKTNGDEYTLKTEQKENSRTRTILYYITYSTDKQTAINDEFPSSAKFDINHTIGANSDFDIKVSGTSSDKLSYDNETKVLTATAIGDASISVSAKDGSGVKKYFYFVVKPPVSGLSNLPENYNLTYPSAVNTSLSNLTVLPSYSIGAVITFTSSNENVFIIQNDEIITKAVGSAELNILINGEIFKTVDVNIMQANPTLNVGLGNNPQIPTENLTINNSTITLNFTAINKTFVSFIIKVKIENILTANMPEKVINNIETVSDNSNIILQIDYNTISSNGEQPCTITVNGAGTFILKFNNTTLNINKEITFKIE